MEAGKQKRKTGDRKRESGNRKPETGKDQKYVRELRELTRILFD